MTNQLTRPKTRPKRARAKGDEIKVKSFTHFMRRMFPGEYCTYSFLIRNPHCTHLYAISCLLLIPKGEAQKQDELQNSRSPNIGDWRRSVPERKRDDLSGFEQLISEEFREREARKTPGFDFDNVQKRLGIGPSVGLLVLPLSLFVLLTYPKTK